VRSCVMAFFLSLPRYQAFPGPKEYEILFVLCEGTKNR
jgi:hypothetical protein